MITMQELKAMGEKERTVWLEENCKVNTRGRQRGLVEGVGVNDAPYCTNPAIDGKRFKCPAYRAWNNMLSRAFSAKCHARQPTYSVVSVCDEWRSFMPFRRWWIKNQVDGWQIDKDLLSDSGLYSPETCVFVPVWLNLFTVDSGAARGAYPIGADFSKDAGKFRAKCCNPMSKKQEHLGYFTTPEEAHLAWRARKLELALELKPKMDSIDPRIYPRVVEIISNAM